MAGSGTPLDPVNLRTFPADTASRTGRPSTVLFTRSTPPLTAIGGYKFPGSPAVNLSSTHADLVLA